MSKEWAPPAVTDTPLGNLALLVAAIPQITTAGDIRYLVTSGMVSALTARREFNCPRRHTDLDVIPFTNLRVDWEEFGVDTYPLENCFAGMPLNKDTLQETAQAVNLSNAGPLVLITHPSYIAVQKLTIYEFANNAFPREKDVQDGKLILAHLLSRRSPSAATKTAFNDAIDSLPRDSRLVTLGTITRIKDKLIRRGSQTIVSFV